MSTMWAASPSELLMQAATRTAGRRRSVARRRMTLIAGLVTPGAGPRNRPSATGGKATTERSPALTSAAAVTGVTWPRMRPIWVAVTMNGSDVACSRPAAMACRRPTAPA